MSIQKIEVSEYTCEKCGYKWINRINGKDGPLPERCAKCKKANWNGEKDISPKERGLRRRVAGFKKLYLHAGRQWIGRLDEVDYIIDWSDEITEKFLNLNPRPTIEELSQVIYSAGLPIKPLNSQNQFTRIGFIPSAEEKNCLIHNPKENVKLRRKEAKRRQEIMQQIIESRPTIYNTLLFSSVPAAIADSV
jgi:hypothetical protein